jgi:hypothetical protein
MTADSAARSEQPEFANGNNDIPSGSTAFFEVDHGRFVPDPSIASGPWNRDQLHGRLMVGLVARMIEQELLPLGFRCIRLTVDLFRVASMDPVELAFEPLREGRRLQVVEVVLSAGSVEVAHATAALLQVTAPPAGTVWSRPPWSVPGPHELVSQPPQSVAGQTYEMRPITSIPALSEGTKVWTRERHALIAGEQVSPFVRVALAADLCSPLSAWGDHGLHYVNCDVTIHLHRPPQREWVGIEVAEHLSDAGLAIGACRIYDETGPLGWVSVSGMAVKGAGLFEAGALRYTDGTTR